MTVAQGFAGYTLLAVVCGTPVLVVAAALWMSGHRRTLSALVAFIAALFVAATNFALNPEPNLASAADEPLITTTAQWFAVAYSLAAITSALAALATLVLARFMPPLCTPSRN